MEKLVRFISRHIIQSIQLVMESIIVSLQTLSYIKVENRLQTIVESLLNRN